MCRDPGLRAYLEALTARVEQVLGSRRCGVWLFGSAVLGDFNRDRSDLDVQAVADARLPLDERRALAGLLDHRSLPCPVRGLEFVLYARDDLARPEGPAFQLNLNTGPRMRPHLAFDAGEDPRFWFVLDVAIGRQHGVALAGPPAREVFPVLPDGLVASALLESLAWHREHADATSTVLAACRAAAWAGDGRWRSKTEAARWARSRFPDPAPVDRALRAGVAGDAPAPHEVGAVLREALGHVRARHSRHGSPDE